MKISDDLLLPMYVKAGIDRSKMHDALRQMGAKHLKTKQQKQMWSESNPTCQYCYVIAEALFWYVAPKDTIPYKIRVPGDPGLHRFLKWPDGTIVDLAVEQFDNYEEVCYDKAQVCYFMQSGGPGPSKRARLLATLLGYNENDWKQKVVL